jgi:hypothetical protein
MDLLRRISEWMSPTPAPVPAVEPPIAPAPETLTPPSDPEERTAAIRGKLARLTQAIERYQAEGKGDLPEVWELREAREELMRQLGMVKGNRKIVAPVRSERRADGAVVEDF